MVDDLVGNKRNGVMCKLDMEKAYDHVCWNFVYYMQSRLGFGQKCRKWMYAFMTISSFAVLVNDGPSTFFRASRDLR